MLGKIKFTVPGNPVGYLRMTRGQLKLMRIPVRKLRPDAAKKRAQIERYLDYKGMVYWGSTGREIPRSPEAKIHLATKIYFSSHRHPDAENVHKAISDAIFQNDKMVSGNFDFFYDAKNPRVEVEIFGGNES